VFTGIPDTKILVENGLRILWFIRHSGAVEGICG
jgi:hypothetical protein